MIRFVDKDKEQKDYILEPFYEIERSQVTFGFINRTTGYKYYLFFVSEDGQAEGFEYSEKDKDYKVMKDIFHFKQQKNNFFSVVINS